MAVIAVIVNHVDHSFLPGGFIGVDVFFVISGYLITGIILRSAAERDFSFLEFYARRLRRLTPALIVMLLSSIVAGALLLSPKEFERLGLHTAFGAFYLINFLLVVENGYFDLASNLKPLLHLWSLGVEEQFYLAWPALMVLGVRFRCVGIVLVALLVLSFWWNVAEINTSAVRVFFLPQYRAWEFAAGGLVAFGATVPLGWGSRTPRNLLLLEAFAAVVGFALVASLFAISAADLYPGWWAAVPVVATVVIITLDNRSRLISVVFGNPVANYIGRVSYPFYLWHWPLLSFSVIVLGKTTLMLRLSLIAAAFLLAALTYHFVEKPIRQSNSFVARVPALLTMLMLVTCTGGALYFGRGLPARVDLTAAIASPGEERIYSDPECLAWAGYNSPYCRLSIGSTEPTVALIGDSHANHYFEGIAKYVESTGRRVVNLGSCIPFPDTDARQIGTLEGCMALGRQMLERVFSAPSISVVLVSSRYAYWISGHGLRGLEAGRTSYVLERHVGGTVETGLVAFESGLRALIAKAAATRKQLVFIYDNPELDFPPSSCAARRPFGAVLRRDCGIDREKVDERQAAYRRVVSALLVEFPKLKTFDPVRSLCNQATCSAVSDGKLLYSDDNHLSPAGSRFVAGAFDF
jgi:peptidoglycan/LPS O-acetylase OafA/YrhL